MTAEAGAEARPRGILVVEDDEGVLAALVEALEGEGYAVEAARTLAEAVRAVGRHAHALVVLDRCLPDGDGLSLIETVRADGRAPVVVFSARDDAAAAREALFRGAVAFVPKGEGLARLLAAVRGFAVPAR